MNHVSHTSCRQETASGIQNSTHLLPPVAPASELLPETTQVRRTDAVLKSLLPHFYFGLKNASLYITCTLLSSSPTFGVSTYGLYFSQRKTYTGPLLRNHLHPLAIALGVGLGVPEV
ncbi:hypothetical protein GALMADRAFT_920384 [Galerina marginata CBS 339.88]|uniref:Uncharacterized protein n=1 Tax=Galerina marginata (strain CBS 339.88) TaxID=685588 RepID=A0A067SEU8_GALM3|nr:hypothetical protein GALMADRAFT_920384 [Galerina marginata CBS 339.88]